MDLVKKYESIVIALKLGLAVPVCLYYAGLTTMNYGSWNLIHSTGTTNFNYYPYVGHNDNPYNPTTDYLWGIPRHVYYTYPATSYTNNNLYNRFYSRQVNQLSDQNSRIVTAWFNLDELDVKNFSFRNVVYVGHPLNAYFYVNSIKDYNVMNRQSTEVELLKLKMGRKKRILNVLKPFCFYCDKEFENTNMLLQHQKKRHFAMTFHSGHRINDDAAKSLSHCGCFWNGGHERNPERKREN